MALRQQGNYWDVTDNAVGYDVTIGTWSSSTAGIGKTVSSTKTKALDVCADNNGATLPTGVPVRATRNRMLVTATQTGEAVAYGAQNHCKATGDCSASTGFMAGAWDYFEAVSGTTTSNMTAGVNAMIDIPSGATIGSGTVAAGVLISSYDLGGTHTGKAACIHMPNPRSGSWDYGMVFGSATGATAANTHTIDSHALAFIIKVRVGTTDGYIPVFADVPA